MQISKFPLIFLAVVVGFLPFCGCSSNKTDRGYLIRHEWACEINRTPWIGCPPDANCSSDEGGGGCKFRRHCGVTKECTKANPCCKTLGCGMWVNPSDPMVAVGSAPKACGLTPFCSPMKPCGLTPYCGKAVSIVNNPNTLMLGNNGMVSPMYGGGMLNPGMMSQGMLNGGTLNAPMQPTPVQQQQVPGVTPNNKVPTVAGPNGMRVGAVPNQRMVPNGPMAGTNGGTLLTLGIVPGVSTITTGGIVAAAGAATPAGVMTPSGVLLPTGQIQPQGVIRACALHPNCNAARPCGLTAGCGMIVPLNVVSNNAVMLASALTAPGVAGGVMQAGAMNPMYGGMGAVPGYVNGNVYSAGGIPTDRTGNGMLVNPAPGQPVNGLTMSGRTQTGYPPIGYAPTGYSPGFPRYAPEMYGKQEADEEDEDDSSSGKAAPTPDNKPQSQMPAPQFHPVPSKPTFQRSEGIGGRRTVSASGRILTRESLNAAMEQAYLEGVADTMDDVQEEMEVQSQEIAKAELQARILRQAKDVQSQFDAQQQAKLELIQTQIAKEAREKAIQQVQFQPSQYPQHQLQSAQFQQYAPQQAQLQQQNPYRQAPMQAVPPNGVQYQQGTAKSFFGSTLDFLTGNPHSSPPPVGGQRSPNNLYAVQQPMVSPSAFGRPANPMQQAYPMQQPYAQYPPVRGSGPGFLDSVKATGSDLVSAVSDAVSPLTEMLTTSSNVNYQPMPQQRPVMMQGQPVVMQNQVVPMGQPMPQIVSVQQHPIVGPPTVAPSSKPVMVVAQNESGVAKKQVRSSYPCPPCPPFDLNPSEPTSQMTKKKKKASPSQMEESAQEKPSRPPTMVSLPKRVLEVEDEEETVPTLIQQAGYVDRR